MCVLIKVEEGKWEKEQIRLLHERDMKKNKKNYDYWWSKERGEKEKKVTFQRKELRWKKK